MVARAGGTKPEGAAAGQCPHVVVSRKGAAVWSQVFCVLFALVLCRYDRCFRVLCVDTLVPGLVLPPRKAVRGLVCPYDTATGLLPVFGALFFCAESEVLHHLCFGCG